MDDKSLAWYDALRKRYRPAQLKILLIGESPPDPNGDEQRFFYSDILHRYDNLYRGVAAAVYGPHIVSQKDKSAVLTDLCQAGFWLIDAVEYPINNRSYAVGHA
jgi:hypothetical protein